MSRSFSSTSTTKVSSNLKKIFEDRENREDRDVEMLPPYNIAMDRTITTSSTVNSLVDFIQNDGEKCVSSRMESENMTVDSSNVCKETDDSKVEVSKTESLNESRKVESTQKDHENGTTRMSVKSETVTSKQSYSVRVETNGRTPLINPGDQLEITRPSSSMPGRIMPLSFSNPAFHFSSKPSRPRDVSPADSGSSVNSGADSEGASSNMEGDVSHTSSSEEPSPKSNRRRSEPPSSSSTSHTLPKAASSRPQISLAFEDQSSNHLGERQSGVNPASGSSSTVNEECQVSSPTDALRAANHARKTAFFASLVSPSEENPGRPARDRSKKKVSEATLKIQDNEPTNLQPIAITIQNPHTAAGSQHRSFGVRPALSLPLEVQSVVAQKDGKLSTISEQSQEGLPTDSQVSQVEISTNSAQHLGLLSLDSSPTRNKSAPKSGTSPPKGSPPKSPPGQQGGIPRPKIRTELSSKPPPDVVSSYTRHIVPEGDGYLIHTKKTTQVQSSQTRKYVVQETGGETDPVWTRRSLTETSHSPLETKKFEEVRVRIEICFHFLQGFRCQSQNLYEHRVGIYGAWTLSSSATSICFRQFIC